MSRAYGVTATLGGKKVRWAGDEYGWQSPASYTKLEAKGQFKLGRKELDALTRYLGPIAQTVGNFQQQVRKATPWLDPVEKTVNRAMVADDKLPSSRIAQGGAVLAQKAGNAANLDPRLSMALPFLVGAVSTGGARSSNPRVAAQFEDTQKILAKLKAKKTGTTLLGAIQGQLDDFEASKPPVPSKPKHVAAPPVVEAAPAPRRVIPNNRSSPWANTPELNASRKLLIDQGLPDPNLRYHPRTTPPANRLARDQKELLATAAPDTQTLKTHLKEFDTSTNASVTVKGVTYTPKSDKIRVVPAADKKLNVTTPDGVTTQHIVKGSKTIQDEVRQLPGHEKTVIDSFQAHHRALLKESADFMGYFDNPSPIHAAYKSNKVYGGTQALNRTDLPVRYHQGDLKVKGDNGRVYRGYLNDAAHERLQAKPGTIEQGFPIQAEQGTSRWSFLADLPSDKERLKYMEYHINDLKRAQRIADESYFKQFLMQPSDAKYGSDPYIGNFAQQVLAPHNKMAPILEQAYKTNRKNLLIDQ